MKHQQAVPHANRQSAARTPFANYGTDDRNSECRHLEQVAGDSLALPPLFRIDARVGAGGIDQANNRYIETFSQLHQTQCLAVTLGSRHAEIAVDFLLRITAFLMPDNHHRNPFQLGKATDDRRIISKGPIPVEFMKILEHHLDIVEGVGAQGMTGKLRNLPSTQIGEHRLGELAAFVLQLGNLLTDIDLIIKAHTAQFVDFGLKIGDRLFEIEKIEIHAGVPRTGKKGALF